MGGMVLETNISEVVTHIDAQTKLEKSETSPTMNIKVHVTLVWKTIYDQYIVLITIIYH